MAMNGTNMGTEVKDALDALPEADRSDMLKCFQAICRAIVDHIQDNATVATSTPNVTAGSDTKTGTGRIS